MEYIPDFNSINYIYFLYAFNIIVQIWREKSNILRSRSLQFLASLNVFSLWRNCNHANEDFL